ncbi:Hpt domain-containing protein [Pelagibius sp. Alg239-R121]|uniref:Hpt domain-containing protein n=1 Tax=Pelagibius sp. Alg239-R121 TaxID=2993448 RepID=UPI0024A77433|nr:Hpt domain-containing protein [Pelagibius sp. Alg239-R121]
MGRDLSELEAQIQAKLRDSFIVAAQERLDATIAAFECFTSERGEEALDQMSRATHDLKGMGDSFGFPSITLIAVQVEQILKSATSDDPNLFQGLRRYFDLMSEILSEGADPGVETTAQQLA